MLSVDHSPITNINKGGQSMHMLTTTHKINANATSNT